MNFSSDTEGFNVITFYSIKFHHLWTEHLWMSTYQCPGRIFVDADKSHVAVVAKESKHKELNASILNCQLNNFNHLASSKQHQSEN